MLASSCLADTNTYGLINLAIWPESEHTKNTNEIWELQWRRDFKGNKDLYSEDIGYPGRLRPKNEPNIKLYRLLSWCIFVLFRAWKILMLYDFFAWEKAASAFFKGVPKRSLNITLYLILSLCLDRTVWGKTKSYSFKEK